MTRSPSITDLILAAIEAEASALDRIAAAEKSLIRHLIDEIQDWYDPQQVDAFVQAAGRADQRSRQQAAGIADAYLRYTFDLLGVTSERKPDPIPDLPRGVPLATEWVRPVKEFRRARLTGLDELEAADRAIERAEKMAEMDVRVAARDAYARRLQVAPDVIGWRRVIHPELTRGGTCGLCIAAADRVYRKEDLQPLHERCVCTVSPVTKTGDPGSPVNAQSLKALYQAAGSTGRQDLAKVRMVVVQHGELGPILRDARHDFRTPADVAQDAGALRDVARAEIAGLLAVLADLEQRAAAGEDVAGPIAWQQDRIEALRELGDVA